MFGKKKNDGATLEAFATAYIADKNAKAKVIIAQAIEETENKFDRAYADGLIEMAYNLEVLTMNERASLKELLYKKVLKK